MSCSETGCDLQGCRGILTIRRARRRNALTRQMLEQLGRDAARLSADPRVRVIVLQSEGPVFCAGMDLAEMQARAAAEHDAHEWLADARVYGELLRALLIAPQPVVAAVQGPAVAGGVGLVLACDLVVACQSAWFSLPEPQRGITAAMVTPLLLYRVGAARASQWLLSGEPWSAAAAGACGICHDVVPSEQLSERLRQLLDRICSGSPAALAATKTQLRHAYPADLEAQLRLAADASARARETPDAREGLQAFLEKRPPAWQTDG